MTNTIHLSRQRIMDVFEGRKPDRIPVCEQAFASSVASEILGYTAYTGSTDLHYYESCAWMDGEEAHNEFVEKCYSDVIALHKKLELDILFLPWRMAQRPAKRIDDRRFLYGDADSASWSVYAYNPRNHTYGLETAASAADSYEDVIPVMKEIVNTFDPTQLCLEVDPLLQRAIREYGDRFEVAGEAGFAIPLERGWLEAIAVDPVLVSEYVEVNMQYQIKCLEAQHKLGIRLINGGGDLAYNSGPIYSPRFFEQYVAPSYQKLFDKARTLGMKYIFRSDGDVWPISDHLFHEGGADAYYEVDYEAGMHFDKLRKKYPHLVLMGNVSCSVLLNGTPQEVAERTRECIQAAYPRVILGSANAILHGTPVENVYAMLQEVKRH